MIPMMQWSLVIDFTIICVSLLAAAILRAKVRFLQRFLVPNAITAGFVGLGIVNLTGRFVPELMPSREMLGNIVYHLLAVTFIAIALKRREHYMDRNAVTTAFHLSLGYAVEGLLGYGLTLAFIFTFIPDLFPTFGMLFAIGFGQSSGQAFALGKGWEALGFVNGGTVGLTFGSLGFLWACFVGIPFLNWGIRKGYVKGLDIETLRNRGFLAANETGASIGRMTSHPDVMATGSFHLAFIGAVYLVNYFFIKALVALTGRIGSDYALQLGQVLWAYHAFFGTLIALLVGMLMTKMRLHHLLDDDILTGISTASVDFLVTAAIMAIELVVVARYLVPILVITILGGTAVMALVIFLAKRSYRDFFFERVISIFGLLTGTVSSGLALLRVVDPGYRTPAARDLVLGSGFSLFFAFPLLLIINMPALNRTVRTYLITAFAILGYITIILAVMVAAGLLRSRKEVFSSSSL
jgi:ESS family glutamate:Na+ symporter